MLLTQQGGDTHLQHPHLLTQQGGDAHLQHPYLSTFCVVNLSKIWIVVVQFVSEKL